MWSNLKRSNLPTVEKTVTEFCNLKAPAKGDTLYLEGVLEVVGLPGDLTTLTKLVGTLILFCFCFFSFLFNIYFKLKGYVIELHQIELNMRK